MLTIKYVKILGIGIPVAMFIGWYLSREQMDAYLITQVICMLGSFFSWLYGGLAILSLFFAKRANNVRYDEATARKVLYVSVVTGALFLFGIFWLFPIYQVIHNFFAEIEALNLHI